MISLVSRATTERFRLNGVDVRVVHPAAIRPPDRFSNRRSLGLELTVHDVRVTLLGDLDGIALREVCNQLENADILLAPHHASRHAAVPQLEKAVTPRLVIVACGRNNRFGFPSEAFLHLFRDTEIRTTAECGLIRVDLDPFSLPSPCSP